jgi:hypothetical protein
VVLHEDADMDAMPSPARRCSTASPLPRVRADTARAWANSCGERSCSHGCPIDSPVPWRVDVLREQPGPRVIPSSMQPLPGDMGGAKKKGSGLRGRAIAGPLPSPDEQAAECFLLDPCGMPSMCPHGLPRNSSPDRTPVLRGRCCGPRAQRSTSVHTATGNGQHPSQPL